MQLKEKIRFHPELFGMFFNLYHFPHCWFTLLPDLLKHFYTKLQFCINKSYVTISYILKYLYFSFKTFINEKEMR